LYIFLLLLELLPVLYEAVETGFFSAAVYQMHETGFETGFWTFYLMCNCSITNSAY